MEVGCEVGEWTCQRILGRGNFGVVALWVINTDQIHRHEQSRRAIKMFQPDSSWDEATTRQVTSRWKNEVDMMFNQVESPFIVATLPLPDEFKSLPGKPPVLSMEFCSGGDLRQILRLPQNAAGLPEPEVRKVLRCIGGAISYLHSIRIIHRDLKPENILLTSPYGQGNGVYKLGDLGFAKGLLQSNSHCSTVLGTVQYLAPEIFQRKSYDVAVDFWSFGVIAFEICCGMRPFLHGRPPSEWIPFVEEKKDDVIAIYEGEDGKPVFSTKFPYNTYLSERLRPCLEMWLKIMLQMDPKKRGKRTSENSGSAGGDEAVGLRMLQTILDMDMLDVYSPAKRLSFAVGSSTTMADVSGWIERDIDVKVDQQLLINSDRGIMGPQDTPCSILPQASSELEGLFQTDRHFFMIPMNFVGEPLPEPPNCVQEFYTICDSSLEGHRPSKSLRLIWPSLIHFLQQSLNQIQMLGKAKSALRRHTERVLYPKVREEMSEMRIRLERLKGILFLEEELRKLETRRTTMPLSDARTEAEEHRDEFADLKTKLLSVSQFIEGRQKVLELPEDYSISTRIRASLEIYFANILTCLESSRAGGGIGNVGWYIESFLESQQRLYQESVRYLRDELEFWGKDMNILETLENSRIQLDGMKRDLIHCRLEKQRRLLTNQNPATVIPVIGDGVEGIQNLMSESIMLETEVDEILRRSLEGAEEIQDTRQRLDWTFLVADD